VRAGASGRCRGAGAGSPLTTALARASDGIVRLARHSAACVDGNMDYETPPHMRARNETTHAPAGLSRRLTAAAVELAAGLLGLFRASARRRRPALRVLLKELRHESSNSSVGSSASSPASIDRALLLISGVRRRATQDQSRCKILEYYT
jgi:hypothetical protein